MTLRGRWHAGTGAAAGPGTACWRRTRPAGAGTPIAMAGGCAPGHRRQCGHANRHGRRAVAQVRDTARHMPAGTHMAVGRGTGRRARPAGDGHGPAVRARLSPWPAVHRPAGPGTAGGCAHGHRRQCGHAYRHGRRVRTWPSPAVRARQSPRPAGGCASAGHGAAHARGYTYGRGTRHGPSGTACWRRTRPGGAGTLARERPPAQPPQVRRPQ